MAMNVERIRISAEVSVMSDLEAVLAEASRLTVVDPLQLIDAIWESLPTEPLPPLSREWLTEIERRSAQLDTGDVTTVPWDEVKAAALRRLENSRAKDAS